MMQLIHGDCLVEMDAIPDGSVDMILADLPYGTTACKWDTVIPFEPLWKQYKRVIKRNGAIVLFGSQPFTSALVMSNPKMFRYSWVWNKRFAASFALCNKRPMMMHEDVCVFSIDAPPYKPMMIQRAEPIKLGGKKYSITAPLASPRPDSKTYYDKYPESIIEVSNRSEVRGLHPTQKPVALLEYLIRTYTNEGETVLDNTMGSGSTGVACVNTNRAFVGIEQDAGYFEIATKRIEDAQSKARQSELELVS